MIKTASLIQWHAKRSIGKYATSLDSPPVVPLHQKRCTLLHKRLDTIVRGCDNISPLTQSTHNVNIITVQLVYYVVRLPQFGLIAHVPGRLSKQREYAQDKDWRWQTPVSAQRLTNTK